MNRTPWIAYLCLASAMAIVGAYVAFSKALVVIFPIFLLAWMRFGMAAVAMAPWLRKPAAEALLNAQSRRLLFLESFFGNFLFSICMLFGIAKSTALAAGVIMAAIPAAVAVLSWLLLKERIGKRVAMGVVCAVAGIALVSLAKSGGSEDEGGGDAPSLVGILLLFGAVTCEALYVVIGKKLSASIGPKRISALINLWGLALVTPFGLWQAIGFPFSYIPASSYVLLFAYAMAASVFTVWLWMTGLRHLPASSAGIFTVFLPLTAAAVGVFVFDERVSTLQGAAFGLALVGVVLATWHTRTVTAAAPT